MTPPLFELAHFVAIFISIWGEGEPKPEQSPRIRNEIYRFELVAPNPNWRLLPTAEASDLFPDALAAGISKEDLCGMVIAEESPEIELEEFANIILGGMNADKVEIVSNERIRFVDREALRFEAKVRIRGVWLRYLYTIFENQGHIFQVLSWAKSSVSAEKLAEFAQGFEVLPGPITSMVTARPLEDCHGVGWFLRDGFYHYPGLLLTIKPDRYWRVVIEDELVDMDADATVGLVREKPDVCLTLSVERITGVDPEKLSNALKTFEDHNPSLVSTGKRIRFRFEDDDLLLEQYSSLDPGRISFLRGEVIRGDFCYHLLVWYWENHRERALEEVQRGLSLIEMMPPRRRSLLEQQLKALPDPQNVVELTESLRDGLYRDFRHRFTWRKPDENWRVLIGDNARRNNPDARLWIEVPTLGLYGSLVVEQVDSLSNQDYHARSQAVILDLESGQVAPKPELRGVTMTLTSQRVTPDFVYELTTAVYRGVAIQLLLWGRAEQAASLRHAFAEARRALNFQDSLTPTVQNGNQFFENRLGYAIQLPDASWNHRNVTPESLSRIGSVYEWRLGKFSLTVAAYCPPTNSRDVKGFEEVLRNMIEEQVNPSEPLGEPTRSTSSLSNVRCQRLSWKSDWGSAVILMGEHNKTVYALVSVSKTAAASPRLFTTIQRGFRFLD